MTWQFFIISNAILSISCGHVIAQLLHSRQLQRSHFLLFVAFIWFMMVYYATIVANREPSIGMVSAVTTFAGLSLGGLYAHQRTNP